MVYLFLCPQQVSPSENRVTEWMDTEHLSDERMKNAPQSHRPDTQFSALALPSTDYVS